MIADALTLPMLSIKLGVSLDRIRREARDGPLCKFVHHVGPLRVVQPEDLPRVREALEFAGVSLPPQAK